MGLLSKTWSDTTLLVNCFNTSVDQITLLARPKLVLLKRSIWFRAQLSNIVWWPVIGKKHFNPRRKNHSSYSGKRNEILESWSKFYSHFLHWNENIDACFDRLVEEKKKSIHKQQIQGWFLKLKRRKREKNGLHTVSESINWIDLHQ